MSGVRVLGFVLVGLGVLGIALFMMAMAEGVLLSSVGQAVLRHFNHLALAIASSVLLFAGTALLARVEHP